MAVTKGNSTIPERDTARAEQSPLVYEITGSAFLLTPEFFRHYDGLYPGLFLYGEETASMILLHKARLHTMRVDTPVILHTGAGSTPDEIRKSKLRRLEIGRQSSRAVLGLMMKPYRKLHSRETDY